MLILFRFRTGALAAASPREVAILLRRFDPQLSIADQPYELVPIIDGIGVEKRRSYW